MCGISTLYLLKQAGARGDHQSQDVHRHHHRNRHRLWTDAMTICPRTFSLQDTPVHYKDKMPKIWNKYSQKRNIGISVPIATFTCLWAPMMGLPFLLEEICGLILGIYKSLTDKWMLKLGQRPRNSKKRNIKTELPLQCGQSVSGTKRSWPRFPDLGPHTGDGLDNHES